MAMFFLAAAFAAASSSPGRLEITAETRNLKVINAVFENLRADGENAPRNSGGAIVIYQNSLDVVGTTYKDCSSQFGGAIALFDAAVSITSSKFEYNYANQIAGSIFSLASIVKVKSTVFVGNYAMETHGAISLLNSKGQNAISDCIFDSNSAGLSGGAVGATKSDLIIEYTSFQNNWAGNTNLQMNPESDSFVNDSSSVGGAIFYQLPSGSSYELDLNAVTFQDNKAQGAKGKDIALLGNINLVVPATVCIASPNNVFLTGGAKVEFKESSAGVCYTPKTRVAGKVAQALPTAFEYGLEYFTDSGPGLKPKAFTMASHEDIVIKDDGKVNMQHTLAYRNNVTITSSQFQSCRAVAPTPAETMGGAIYCVHTQVVINNAEFVTNFAYLGGAIAVVSSSLKYTSTANGLSRISYNTAADASGVYALSSDVSFSNVQIMSCSVNTTTGIGALVIDRSSATIVDCTFQQNKRGALSIRGFTAAPYESRTEASITGCCFYMNTGVHLSAGYDVTVSGYAILHVKETLDTDISSILSFLVLNKTEESAAYLPVVNFGSAVVNYGTNSCRSSAPGYQESGDKNKDVPNSGLPMGMIIGVAVGALALIVVLILFIVLRRSGDVDSDDEDDYAMTKTDDTFDDYATSTYTSSDLPSVTIKNGLCTVAARDTSDSLFDDFDADLD